MISTTITIEHLWLVAGISGAVGGVVGAAMCISLHRFLSCAPLLIGLLATAAMAQSPLLDVRTALADSQTLANPAQARYLSLSYLPATLRGDCIVAVNYAVNSLSRTRGIYQVAVVSPTVLRIDAEQYCNDAKELDQWESAWSNLAATDPYFHLTTQVAYAGKVQTVIVAGGWTDPTSEAALRQRTATPGYGAILRADWFAVKALDPPYYYQFSGTGATEEEWLKSLGVDAATVDRLQANAGANLLLSGVTKKTRRVIWSQGPLGGWYKTLDVRVADAARSPFYRPISADGSATKFDAAEEFALLGNGMWATLIADNKGKRLDVVDPVIAHDYIAESYGAADVQIYAGRSCIVCHGGESGLNSFTDDQSRLLRTKKGRVELRSYSPDLVRRTLSFYDEPRLQRQLKFDRETHEMAVKRACDTTPAKATAALQNLAKNLLYDPVAPQKAACEIGVPEKDLIEVIDGTSDPVGIALAEGDSVQRGNFEAFYPELSLKAERWNKDHPK